MTFTVRELEEHPIWENIALLSSHLDAFDGNGDADALRLSGDMREVLAALETLKSAPSWRFPSKPDLAGDLFLNVMPALNGVKAFLDTAKAGAYSTDEAMVTALDGAVDALTQAANTVLVAVPPVTEVLSSASLVSAVRADGEAAVSALQKKVEAREKEVEELRTRISEEQTKFDDAVGEWQRQVAEQTTQFANQTSRVDVMVTNQTTAFGDQMKAWDEENEQALGAHSAAVTAMLENAEKKFIVELGERTSDADVKLDKLAAMEKEAEILLASTSRWTISTHYGQYASGQGKAATWWAIAAVGVALGGLIYLTATLNSIQNLSVGQALVKSAVSVSILVVSGFMAKVYLGHFKVARDAKRVQLDLDALEPFIRQFDEETRQAHRNLAALRVFGRPMADTIGTDNDFLSAFDKQAMDSIVKAWPFGSSASSRVTPE